MTNDGEMFGPYRLLELIGRGGMGEVWRAYDVRRERTVALKRLGPRWADSDEFRERFRREARATAGMDSPHVVHIHDFGEIDDELFIDMRLVPGGDLAAELARFPHGFPSARAAALVAQIAGALDAAHRRGLLHRDVKPSNVLLEPDRTGERAYLVDFGIVKSADESRGGELTEPGDMLGTPAYMAPELFGDAGAAGRATDVYALGCVLFEMLTGRRPYLADGTSGYVGRHVSGPVPRPSATHPGLSAFDPVVARAMAKDPACRYPSAGDLGDDALAAARLTASAATAGGDRPVPAPRVPERPRWRRRGVLLTAAGAVLVAAVVVAGLVVRPGGDGPAAVAAPEQVPGAFSGPVGVVFDADGRRAWVADSGLDAVLVLDTATGATVASVPAGPGPNEIALAPDGRHLYAADTGSDDDPGDTVTVIDTGTNAVTATIRVGAGPLGLAVLPDGRVYVCNAGGSRQAGTTVSVIDPAANAVVATIPVGPGPYWAAAAPDGRRVYVPVHGAGDRPGDTVTVIDTATGRTSALPAGENLPNRAVPSPDGRRVFLSASAEDGPGSVQVIDVDAGTVRPLVAGGIDTPEAMAVTPDGRTLVVAAVGRNERPASLVAVVDVETGTVRRTVTLGGRPLGVGITPDGGQAWVTTGDTAGLWRIPLLPVR